MNDISQLAMDKVFGADAHGSTPLERARASRRQFVRGQTMIAEASPRAEGRRLTAAEALLTFGFDILLAAVEHGQARLVPSRDEPAQTLRERREEVGYTREDLAKFAKISFDDLTRAETPGKVSPIRLLEKLSSPLAFDERTLGFTKPNTAERQIANRLRQLANGQANAVLKPKTVAALAEGAWVIARQRSLAKQLGQEASNPLERFKPDPRYDYPTYARGYELAEQTRDLLGLGSNEAIPSMRALVADTLSIPLVETRLGLEYAGATVATGDARGIVVNIEGSNENVWVRRMTIAHELGHLLWDPAQKLNRLAVDRYDELPHRAEQRDPVEIRANAFAVALLAPPSAVKRIVAETGDVAQAVVAVATQFGISVTAAVSHVGNITRSPVSMPRGRKYPRPSDELQARENSTIDFFPIRETPPSRVGRFAWIVMRALQANLLSHDSAAALLQTSESSLGTDTINAILDLTAPRQATM